MAEKGERVKRKYGMLHEIRHFTQLRTRARQTIVRNVVAAVGLITGTVVLAFVFKAVLLRTGFWFGH